MKGMMILLLIAGALAGSSYDADRSLRGAAVEVASEIAENEEPSEMA
jgi:hypothetical protein